MDQSPPYPPEPHGALIEEGGHLAGWLIAHLRDLLADTLLSLPLLRHLVRHYLTPAESALRRAIHLIADSLEPIPAPAKPAPRKPVVRPRVFPTKSRAPAFRLTEPALRQPTDNRRAVRAAPSKPSPDTTRLEARLHRRLAAFDAAYADPLIAARRLQRLRLRKRPALTRIPGLRAEPINETALALLERLQATVEAEASRRSDTS